LRCYVTLFILRLLRFTLLFTFVVYVCVCVCCCVVVVVVVVVPRCRYVVTRCCYVVVEFTFICYTRLRCGYVALLFVLRCVAVLRVYVPVYVYIAFPLLPRYVVYVLGTLPLLLLRLLFVVVDYVALLRCYPVVVRLRCVCWFERYVALLLRYVVTFVVVAVVAAFVVAVTLRCLLRCRVAFTFYVYVVALRY